jgi:hypothetical protein
MTGDAGSRLAAFIDEAAAWAAVTVRGGDRRPAGPLASVAVGWATVELDRAASELTAELGLPAGAFSPAAADAALGARCRVAPGAIAGPGGDLALVLLEPSTEGRLAATLARSGEGPAAAWFTTDDETRASAALRDGGIVVAAPRDGPLGPARLILAGPVHGPHRFLVAHGPGTIAG